MTDDPFSDRFVLKEPVGSGATGTVYRAWDLLRREHVAVKLQRPKNLRQQQRFEREALLLAELSHPAIVSYIAHGVRASGEHYLAMEWLEGETLEARLARLRMSTHESVALGMQVLSGVAAAHAAGVVHRDIKPANLFLKDKRAERTKITDLGIALRLSDPEKLTHPGIVVGTPLYMSPEQARGDSAGEPKSDIFAVGGVLYECLSGQPPFAGVHVMAILAKIALETPAPLRALRPDLPDTLESLLERMLSKDGASRPDAEACIAELSLIRAELGNEDVERESSKLASMARSESLPGGREQRVLCVVLVGNEPGAVEEMSAPIFSRERTTLDDLEAPGTGRKGISESLEPFGAKLCRLLDGSMVLTLPESLAPAEQALRAARCALTLQALLPRCPIALATGRAVVNLELPYGAVIDAGARLIEPSNAGMIRLDEATAALLDGRFEIGGSADKLLLGDEGRDEEEPRTLLGKVTETVGRDRDIDMLERVFDDCQSESSARAVLIKAPAGAGKTRLRYELLRRLRKRGVSFELLLGRADSMNGASPFALLAPALRKAAGILRGDSLAVRRGKVRASVGAYVKDEKAIRIAVFLGELMGVPFPDEESLVLAAARLEPRLMADQILASWLDWLETVSSVRPVVVVLEDLHSGDLPSVQFVDAALRTLDQRPLLVLGLARPAIEQRFPGLFRQRELVSLHLGKLPKKSCASLVDSVLGERVIAEKRAWLVERSEGNAFYLEELIRAVAVGAPNADLPDTVLGMLQARLDALGDDGKRVLRAASVFGETFRDDAVRALLGGERCQVAVEPWLLVLVKQEMIFSKGALSRGEYSFRQGLLRDAAYATLTDEDRALGHRLAGEWLEHNNEVPPLVLAEHFELGGVRARAAGLYRIAAEKALEANDLSLTILCADRGVAQGAQGELLSELAWLKAEAHQWRGESTEAEAASREAMRWLEKGSAAWYRAAGTLVMANCRRGNGDEAVGVAEEMLALSTHADAARTISMALAAGDMMLLGRLSLAEAMIERIKREAAGGSTERTRGNVQAAEAMIAIVKFSDPSSCLKHARAALASFQRAGDVRSASWQLVNVGFALIELGLYEEAETALREADALAERMGVEPIAASARQNLGMALVFQGRLDAAEITLASAMESFRTQGDLRQEATCRMYMARLFLVAGKAKQAEAEAGKAVELFTSFPALQSTALATLAGALASQSQKSEALAAARAAMALLEATGSVEGESFVRLVHAIALSEAGAAPEARLAIDEAERGLLERARFISDATLRQSFLENVPDNRDIIALAARLRESPRHAAASDR